MHVNLMSMRIPCLIEQRSTLLKTISLIRYALNRILNPMCSVNRSFSSCGLWLFESEFFAHEIQSSPPSLSELGKLDLPSAKSELLQCIEQSVENEPPAMFDCMVLDGPVIVHSLPTSGVTTFNK